MALTAMVGGDVVKTKTQTTEYFSDINGDGLIDLVSNGKVYFNHIEFDSDGNAVPTFTESSADTPSPIIYSGEIDASVITISPEEQEEAIAASPMQDIVRVWQAPKAGTVSVSGTVRLVAPEGDYDTDEYAKADGVRVAVQKGGTEYWSKEIAKGDGTAYEASASGISVQAGDRIYFRVQSGTEETANGSFDNVEWSPTVTYSGTSETLPNGYSTTVYKPEEGAIYDAITMMQVDGAAAFTVSGKFTKPATTDEVTLRVIGSNDPKDADGNDNPGYVEKEVYSKTFAPGETAEDTDIEASIDNADKLTNFSFEVTSTSNVDWANVKWNPSITYTDTAGVERTVAVPVHYATFAKMLHEGAPYTVSPYNGSSIIIPRDSIIHFFKENPKYQKGGSVYIGNKFLNDTVFSVATLKELTITPNLDFSGTFNGDVTLSAKTADALLGKITLSIANGVIPNDTLFVIASAGEKVWLEYSYGGILNGDAVLRSEVRITEAPIVQSFRPTIGRITLPAVIEAGFFAENANEGFGMMYRGWGGFVYNASEGRCGKPIDESLLKLPESEDVKIDPMTMAFTPIGTDQNTLDRWVGQRQDIYLTAYEAGTARLGDQDVIVTNPLDNDVEIAGLSGDCLQGTGAAAVTQVASNKSNVAQSGAMGITYNDADGNATTEVTMMDMNGDGYPDIVAGGTIQYTNTLGGLSGEKLGGIGNTTTDNASESWGYGGNPVASVSDVVNMFDELKNKSEGGASTTEAASNAKTSWEAQFSISFSAPKNTDEAVEAFVDINGDGLPDKILSDKKVRLNYGYSFSAPVDWELDRIQGGSSRSYSAGASADAGVAGEINKSSISKASGSFAAGVGIVTSESEEEFNLMDINGDGLPDKVWTADGSVMAALNTGNGFSEQTAWNGATALNKSASTSESMNAAFTVTITVPIPPVVKISTNPGTSTGHSISRPKYALQDVDGDGFLDIDKPPEIRTAGR